MKGPCDGNQKRTGWGEHSRIPATVGIPSTARHTVRMAGSWLRRTAVCNFVGWLVFAFGTPIACHAAAPANPEDDRLRSALRQMTEQLRSVQSDLAALQATHVTTEQEKKDLQAKFESLAKKSSGEKQADDRTIATLQRQVEARAAENAKLKQELAGTNASWTKTSSELKAMTAERERLAAENAQQHKRIISLQAKNVALFLVGNEILRRYEDFGLGSALKAKEPFVGSTRARLETLVQDLQDQLLDARDLP